MSFFFDAEVGIRAGHVPGVQTCALPIFSCFHTFCAPGAAVFGTVQKTAALGAQKVWKQETVEGAAQLLEQASHVVVIPGYGMAEIGRAACREKGERRVADPPTIERTRDA